jgi:hypothetical protein
MSKKKDIPHTASLEASIAVIITASVIESSWNVMAHGDAREEKWRGKWRMEWLATLELGVSSITAADAHTSAGCSFLNWRPCRFKWTCPFRRKTKFGFCPCAITLQTQSSNCASEISNPWHSASRISGFCNIRKQVKISIPTFEGIVLKYLLTYEILTALNMKVTRFWVMMQCSSVGK